MDGLRQPNSESLQQLAERFHRAGWIDGVSMVSPEPFSMDMTPLGLRRIRQLFVVFKGMTTDNFPDSTKFRAKASGSILMDQFEEALSDLIPPALSQAEKDTLLGLTIVLAKRQSW